MSKLKAAVKAGKLANGFERGKGRVVHIVNSGESLCGQRPAISWSERDWKETSCKKCIDQFLKEKFFKKEE